jgi:hypothetical protein
MPVIDDALRLPSGGRKGTSAPAVSAEGQTEYWPVFTSGSIVAGSRLGTRCSISTQEVSQ